MRSKGIVRALPVVLGWILCAALLVSCTASTARLNIELIAAGTETEFWVGAYTGAQEAAEQYNANVKLFGSTLEKDYGRQANILRQSIARKPDAILLAVADGAVMGELIDLAAKSGISVIAVDSPVGAEQSVPYVGSDNDALGRTLAREIKSRCAVGRVAVLRDIEVSPAEKEREAGFLAELSKSPEYQILETVYCESNVDTAKKLTRDRLSGSDRPAAIACLSEATTIGAGKAVEETSSLSVVLAGVGCSEEEARLMERGILDVTLFQNPYAMGYYGLKTAIQRLRGEPADAVTHTEFHIITKENMFSEENQRLIFPLS